MKQVHIHGKVFDDTDFKNLVIGGQNNADTIQFVLPKIFGNEIDFSSSDWIFTITYVNKEGEGDAVVLTKSDSSKSENIYLDWKPSQTATQVEGKLTCQLSGTKKNADADDVSRFTTKPFAIYVDKYLSPEPITQSLPSVIEQALEMMAEYNADVQHAIQIGEAAEENANAAAGSASDAASSASEAESSKVAAAGSASEAEFFAKISERYAKGTEDGVAVSSGEGYQDNAKYYKELCAQLASSVDGPELLAKITAIQDKIDAQEALNEARGGLAPGKYWWLGPEENLPERCFIINGQPLPKPTETSDLYKIPYGEFGEKYTTEETPAGYFGTPDFMTRADGTNGPNYIGSTGDFAQVGTKLIDTIRNITGKKERVLLVSGSDDTPLGSHGTGPFEDTDWGRSYYIGAKSDWWTKTIDLVFDASKAVATSSENKPYTILAVPIYVY